jgi:REP element-mobilizing transposase RayT
MARKPRIHFPGAFYHVIARGNQKQDIFLDEKDFKTYLAYLSEYKARFNFHLYAYVLMKNHLHLLLEVGKTPLSRIMHVLQFRYTRYFNKRYGKVGHLFQGRYKVILCDKEVYLLELVRYIHLNPVRSMIVDDPEKYLWTGHICYLGRAKNNLIDQEVILSQFSKNKTVARKAYLKFILQEVNGSHQESYYRVKDQRYLGEDKFIDKIEGNKRCTEPELYDIPLDHITLMVSNVTGISQEKLHSLTRDRKGAYGRSLVAYLARKVSGQLVKDIARHFKREPMTISPEGESNL